MNERNKIKGPEIKEPKIKGGFNMIFDKINEHLHKPENKSWINQQILNPVASYIEGYLKPYFLTLILFLFAIVLLLVYNLRILFKIDCKLNT